MPPDAGQVGSGRWGRVEGGRAHRVHAPQLACAHGVASRDEGRVEAARVADLHRHSRPGESVAHRDGLVCGAGDRLLAEGRDAATGRRQQQLGVRAGDGRDDDTVNAGIQHRLGGADDGGLTDPSGDGVTCSGHGVGHDELVHPVEGGERVGVEGADPAEADESDAHLRLPWRPAFARTWKASRQCSPISPVAVNHMF